MNEAPRSCCSCLHEAAKPPVAALYMCVRFSKAWGPGCCAVEKQVMESAGVLDEMVDEIMRELLLSSSVSYVTGAQRGSCVVDKRQQAGRAWCGAGSAQPAARPRAHSLCPAPSCRRARGGNRGRGGEGGGVQPHRIPEQHLYSGGGQLCPGRVGAGQRRHCRCARLASGVYGEDRRGRPLPILCPADYLAGQLVERAAGWAPAQEHFALGLSASVSQGCRRVRRIALHSLSRAHPACSPTGGHPRRGAGRH